MIITLVTGEKVTVKESFEGFSIDRELKDYNVELAIFTKQTPNGHTVKNGELTQNYKESTFRVDVNYIVSYEE